MSVPPVLLHLEGSEMQSTRFSWQDLHSNSFRSSFLQSSTLVSSFAFANTNRLPGQGTLERSGMSTGVLLRVHSSSAVLVFSCVRSIVPSSYRKASTGTWERLNGSFMSLVWNHFQCLTRRLPDLTEYYRYSPPFHCYLRLPSLLARAFHSANACCRT